MDDPPRFLRVARALASVVAPVVPVASLLACGGPASTASVPVPIPASASNVGPDATSDPESTSEGTVTETTETDGSGPCRCSWDTNASAAPRVCKKGETNYAGAACVPASRPKYPIAIGPLPPPDLPS